MTIALHLCRGNYKGRWMAQGGYEAVAESCSTNVEVDSFFLEYDSARAGGFEPLRHVPEVEERHPRPDQQQDARARAARRCSGGASTRPETFIPLDQAGVSPQCGFASSVGGNPLSIDDERRKLARVVELAQAVWG